jgi:hypothetical protein
MNDSSDEENDDRLSTMSDETNFAPDPNDANLPLNKYLTCRVEEPTPDVEMPNVPVLVPSSQCWLCTFSPHAVAIQMHEFINANIASMDCKYIASQIKDEIISSFPHAQGAQKRDITRHINEHMIAPHVRMAGTIKSLVRLAETLQGGLTHRDAETNEVLVDVKNTELYLKVVSQIISAYKLDSTKLMFSTKIVTQK